VHLPQRFAAPSGEYAESGVAHRRPGCRALSQGAAQAVWERMVAPIIDAAAETHAEARRSGGSLRCRSTLCAASGSWSTGVTSTQAAALLVGATPTVAGQEEWTAPTGCLAHLGRAPVTQITGWRNDVVERLMLEIQPISISGCSAQRPRERAWWGVRPGLCSAHRAGAREIRKASRAH
jgi:hypothetical protein